MPGHTIVGHRASLRLTLSNEGETLDTQIAATGEAAIKTAVMMIVSRDELRHGDILTVRFAEDGQNATVVRGLRRPEGATDEAHPGTWNRPAAPLRRAAPNRRRMGNPHARR